ncbi:glucose-6-phosphate isomerase [Simiduia agarivorans]|uniref:Glucose-6-phosphate isomerase n=1 Tax=Simiduia agarivorans (strain DSM 21679 / JCM 13881 / BCRC 17597 / SA1) TaxID=1117647 RepID=K4KPN4_SIMAS|nr:glucose-6-phosphate isomerase [Simiduia agarivorans]AFV01012.1 glucose-6-phosphate isomerase [Simiduia agarivorans SA1 = DSM 21679]
MTCRTQLPEWQNLAQHAQRLKKQRIADLFEDSSRFDAFSRPMPFGLYDFSKTLLDQPALEALLALARKAGVEGERARMLAGEPFNATEQRAVQHMALRAAADRHPHALGQPVQPQIDAELGKMEQFSDQVRQGRWRGYSGKQITDVVAIGIGGSNLGPQMVCEALASYAEGPALHFVSNVDGVQISRTLAALDPQTTLFVVSSKTFTTRETMANAATARRWLVAHGGEAAVAQHFVAVTSAVDKARAMGISPDNIFAMWDWVGGRFSLWSAIGLPIALYLGMPIFRQILAGARVADEHFTDAPLEQNVPVLMALLGVWHINFLGMPTHAILPYDQALKYLPAYLQQAEMESNGKSVTRTGNPVAYDTGAIVWGQLGIDGQHAFYQLLHQGTHEVALDFIGSAVPVAAPEGHHEQLLANMFAQTQALMNGCDVDAVRKDLLARGYNLDAVEQLVPHKVHRGNRGSCTFLLDKITPASLGSLVALYEHKIFVQGVLWDVCSFDQWGVELGKQLIAGLEQQLTGTEPPQGQDSSTTGLINYYRKLSHSKA